MCVAALPANPIRGCVEPRADGRTEENAEDGGDAAADGGGGGALLPSTAAAVSQCCKWQHARTHAKAASLGPDSMHPL